MTDCIPWMIVAVLALAAPLSMGEGTGQDWPNWRGPSHNGVSAETNWDADWSDAKPKVAWKRNVGTGASSVSVVGDRVYTMGNAGDEDTVWCLDINTGELIWQQSYRQSLDKRMFEGGTATTPTVADGKVYTLSHKGDLYCFDADSGKEIWKTNIVSAFDAQRPKWGFAASPLVVGKAVIIETGSESGSTVALNKDTGKLIWKSGNDKGSYASPLLTKIGGRDVLLSFRAKELVAMNAADGKQLWSHEWKTSWDINATPPVALGGDKLFVSTGYNRGCAVLNVRGGRPVVLWQNRELSTQMNAAVFYDGYIYGVNGNNGRGDLVCLRASDGKLMWTADGYGTGAVMIADGHLIVSGEKRGKLAVAPASPDGFEPTGEMEGLVSGRSWVVPVLSHGRIFVKDNKGNLAAVDVRP